MKKLFIFICIFASAMVACTSKTSNVPTAGKDLIVERAVLVARNSGVNNVLLFTDGTTFSVNAYDSKLKLIQKGDTVSIQGDKVSVRFRRDAYAPDKEGLVVERAVLVARSIGVHNVLLFTDGSIFSVNAYDNERKLIQKGDKVTIQGDKVSVRFHRDTQK